jgi:molybdopterin/thiamine biosynthesis adenylyltransferase
MRSDNSLRYARQYGLVHQSRVEDLNVLVVGRNELLPFLLTNLALCGVGTLNGGVYLADAPVRVGPSEIAGQFLLRDEDQGLELLEALAVRLCALAPDFDLQPWPADGFARVVPDIVVELPREGDPWPTRPLVRCVVGQPLPSGVLVGPTRLRIEPFSRNVFTPALASLGGAMVAQELVRVTNCLRQYRVEDQRIALSMRVTADGLGDRMRAAHGTRAVPVPRFRLGGEQLEVLGASLVEGEYHSVDLTLAMPSGNLLTRLIADSVELVEEPLDKRSGFQQASILVSPLGNEAIDGDRATWVQQDYPRQARALKSLVLGVGGIGSWVTALLACTPAEECVLTIVDEDRRIEEHNLNRQVLFTLRDLGRAKVDAARGELLRINPNLSLEWFPVSLDDRVLDALHHGGTLDATWRNKCPEDRTTADPEVLRSGLLAQCEDAGCYLACPDNRKSRWIVEQVARARCRPFVTAGADQFLATVDGVFSHGRDLSLEERYGPGTRTDVSRRSCTGPLPMPAIVTTNAIAGSMQALFAIAAACGIDPRGNHFAWKGNLGVADLVGLAHAGAEAGPAA